MSTFNSSLWGAQCSPVAPELREEKLLQGSKTEQGQKEDRNASRKHKKELTLLLGSST